MENQPQVAALREQIERTARRLDQLAQELEKLGCQLATLSDAISAHLSKRLEIRGTVRLGRLGQLNP